MGIKAEQWTREVCSTCAGPGAAPVPAVNRDVVEATLADGLHRGLTIDQLTRTVCAAIDDDPAVHVVRESDIAAVEVERGARKWIANGEAVYDVANGPDGVREQIGEYLTWVADAEAVARAIEAEQATDPVEVLADDFARTLAGDERVGGSWSMNPSDWRDITLALAKRAKDVLGREADQ